MKIKLLLFLFLIGCSVSGTKRVNVEEYQSNSTIVKYFLPDIPSWANFSQSAQCGRNIGSKVLNLKKLEVDTSFEYGELIQFQFLYNIEFSRLVQSLGGDTPSIKEEEKLFYNTLANIRSGIYGFNPPKYKIVNLIWIDPYLKNRKEFLDLMKSHAMYSGHPVFISLCLSHQEVVELIKKNDLQNKDIRILSFEAFSPYDVSLAPSNSITLDFYQFFDESQKLILYNPKEYVPTEFFGNFQMAK